MPAWRDYVSLLKLRIAALLLLVAAAGYLVAGGPSIDPAPFGLLMASGLLASGGASAVNHYVDRDVDRAMARTRGRPIPIMGKPAASPSRAWWSDGLKRITGTPVASASKAAIPKWVTSTS